MPGLILTDYRTTVRLASRHLEIGCEDEAQIDAEPGFRRIPLHDIERVIAVGRARLTLPVMLELLKENIPFRTRQRRPPPDPANALLSFAYTILLTEIDTALRSHGLDPALGILHEVSVNRPSLALDLIEPLRAPVADLLVMNILNHAILTADDFTYSTEDGGCFLKTSAHKAFFRAYEHVMTRRFTLGKGEPHIDFRDVISQQVMTFIRAIEGQDEYAFFTMP